MPVPSISFVLGVLALFYISTFVIFAILRVVTGVSIQRLGYFGFRRITFSPRNGIKLSIRGISLAAHRPTYALPTWCSLVITEACVTVDLKSLGEAKRKDAGPHTGANGQPAETAGAQDDQQSVWERLSKAKEQLKSIHSKIQWLRLVDLVVTNAEINVVGVGSISVERATLCVDTRSQIVDRSRLFQHHKAKPDSQSPAEWKSIVRSVLFTPEGRESTEILDYCTFNVHGFLQRDIEGLRDASIALKLGRFNVPYDDIEAAQRNAAAITGYSKSSESSEKHADGEKLHELVQTPSNEDGSKSHLREERLMQNLAESRKLAASLLGGIQEVQFAVGFFGLSRKLPVKGSSCRDVYFNIAMKEVGLDVLRLDSKSPAHKMYFSPGEVAHQGLLTAIAISAGIDDGHEHPERMLYIPMITATVRTTLPSRTMRYVETDYAGDKNTNLLYANFVCTSPSIDLDPKHLPLMLELLEWRSDSGKPTTQHNRSRLISRILPKASVKLSIQEPVIRVSLPPRDPVASGGDFDLLISSVSSVSLGLESSHSQDGRPHYSLATDYRHVTHQLYYLTAAGQRHDLLHSDTVELKAEVNAIPDLSVTINGRLNTFVIYMNRPEISQGVQQIVKALRKQVLRKRTKTPSPKISFLRRVPAWLKQCHLEGHDFGIQIAGIDSLVSDDPRGFMLELETWSTNYTENRQEASPALMRRRSMSRTQQDTKARSRSPEKPRVRRQGISDGRRLTFHLQNLEGLIVEPTDDVSPEPFMSLPQFEIAFSTSTDSHGPLFHINSFTKSILLRYSLFHHFSIGVATMVIKRTFLDDDEKPSQSPAVPVTPTTPSTPSSLSVPGSPLSAEEVAALEITTIDIKANLIQVKAMLPSDPPMMLQIYGIDAGRHRWATPFVRSKLARLYVRAPATKSAWSRIVSMKTVRLDIRDLKRRATKHHGAADKSFDLTAETIRIGVPHSLIVHNIFDNITNIVKTSKQMNHHFNTGTDEYILVKEPEGPKYLPRISVRTQIFIFEIEDSLFEWKLGAIYRAGLAEQKQRAARDDVFKAKEKRVSRAASRSTPHHSRSHSAHGEDRARPRYRHRHTEVRTSHSAMPTERKSSDRRNARYETEGKCGISDGSKLTIAQAREKLQKLNAQTWRSRIDRVIEFQRMAIRDIRRSFWGMDHIPEESEQHEPILAMTQRPGLMAICMSDLAVTIDRPSFAVEDFPQFLHKVGKGMPADMKYGLTVPMSIHITTGEARFQLRDYPLPLLHIPPLANGQSPRLPAMSMKTDFVLAEEFRDIESQKSVDVIIVPADKMADGRKDGYAISVRRSISPVKTYSDMKFEINTSHATRFTWGSSYMPALQDTMQVIEGFTKPPFDPSERVGFWDKVRLSFHSRVNVAWKGDGDVHLIFKGSRDPYVLTGEGAGLVMVWRNDVVWNVAVDPDPRKFMTVDSGDYILAVPDFNSYARHQSDHDEHEDGSSSISSSHKRDAVFKKVVMKLSGNVRWLAGLMFERDLPDGGRSFDFKPHYNVVLKHPDFAKPGLHGEYDAYRNFRSNHIHMSVAVAAPHDRNWSVSNLKPSSNYNSVHLTPRFFSHFFAWWKMFGGAMSLPIRQGPLWGVTQKKSKKFGRHIATIKYNLLLSPLYISHIYKHKEAEDYKEDSVSVTGLKMKLDSFMLDMHQRREHFDIPGHAGAETKRSSAMKINQAQLDFISADLRAISASIRGTTTEDIEKATDETMSSLHEQTPSVDISKFTIPDNDFTWIDMDDFVELDWILPAESDPETKILPLGYAPRFTYFRQTEHGDAIAGDRSRTSRFGDEPTHFCVMSEKNDPRRIQALLIEKRLKQINVQIAENERNLGAQELKNLRAEGENSEGVKNFQMLREHAELLEHKASFLKNIYDVLIQRLETDDPTAVPGLETNGDMYDSDTAARTLSEEAHMDSAPLADYSSDFNNRFIIHNPQIKWNNSLRNIILRYIHQNSQRRGFVYYMSRRAVKFILDVLDEQKKNDSDDSKRRESFTTPQTPFSPDADDDEMVQDRIEALLRDGRDTVIVEEPSSEGKEPKSSGPTDEIAVEYTPLSTYHVRLIAPQIQLQSEKNSQAVVLVTAKGIQLKVIQIMDKDRVNDDVSGLVQRRFTAAMDSLQMFTTSSKTFSTKNLNLYAGNRYGVKAGSHWPPWVPFEVMFDFQTNPYGFDRVVHRTSASVRYDKHNNLRLKYNDDVSGKQNEGADANAEDESHMDHIWLEFPHFRCICDSDQYFSLYIMVMDLLLYNEPLEKTRSERLEKIMLASDFSDLTGAPEMVQMLQERIRQLEEIKTHFDVHEGYLDRQGWKDRIIIDRDVANCEDELFFMLKAITTAQQRVDDRRDQEHARGMLRLHTSASEIAWHLRSGKNNDPLVEFQLKDASFDRTDYNDGSNYNCGEVGRINGLNLLPDALYPEIIGPFVDSSKGFSELGNNKMLRVQWLMLEAIAGIPVVDHFEIDLVPLKLQVERDVAKKLFEYIFPGAGGKAFDSKDSSPFMVKNRLPDHDDEDDSTDKADKPDASEVHTTDADSPNLGNTNGNGAGSLERRLVPTLHLPNRNQDKRPESRGLGIAGQQKHSRFGFFQHSDKSRTSVASRSSASRQALGSTNLSPMVRSPSGRSLSTMHSETGSAETEKEKEKEKAKRFSLIRSNSDEGKKNKKKKERSDDLTQMMNRASNYMTLAYVKLPSIVLCLSYKGKGHRNIEDVHDLVFRMPTLEYRNKTWSNLDLAMQLKKDVIKALISHAGAIVGNKFSHPKPNRQQQNRLREIANRSTIMSRDHNGTPSETSSVRDHSPGASFVGRPSTATGASSMLRSSMSIRSSAADSSTDLASRPATSSARMNGHGANGDTVHDPMPAQTSSSGKANGLEPPASPPTSRVASLTRRVSGFGQRLRQGDNSGPDEAEESKRKSKILLGGQKLFRSLKE
ncbi:hypothetical protein AMS68_000117 [Peltaster fructicola]|uniref:FMP27 GFWDK domain-containing protein n=1 Tax=Peltaster fructicola TaxID=286661 RepID=A0A6H0XJ94_9PEZI|nr:hypothetical protein AMS68_000117 [Peltaster fructicola]